jgi:hypothetical protein
MAGGIICAYRAHLRRFRFGFSVEAASIFPLVQGGETAASSRS